MPNALPRIFLLTFLLVGILTFSPPSAGGMPGPQEYSPHALSLAHGPTLQDNLPVFRFPVVPGSTPSGYFDHQPSNGAVTFYDGRRNNPGAGFYFSCSTPAMYDWVGCVDAVAGEPACDNSRELWYDNHHGTDYEYSPNWHTGARCDPARFAGITMPVYAPARAKVLMAGYDPNRPANGWHIRLKHDLNGNGNFDDDNFRSVYLHFTANALAVFPGQIVEEGQYLGLGGSTGYSSSPHLHFEVQRSADYFQTTYWPVDPYGWKGSDSDPWTYTNVDLWRQEVRYTNFIWLPAILNPLAQCDQCGEMLRNGSFEDGHTGWAEPGVQMITRTGDPDLTISPRTGEWLAWLAGRDNASDTIYQEFSLPGRVKGGSLRYAILIHSEELGGPNDYFYVRLRLPDGSVLQEIDSFDNTFTPKDQWVQREIPLIDLSAWEGQPIRVTFKGTTNASETTSFYLDDVSLVTTGE